VEAEKEEILKKCELRCTSLYQASLVRLFCIKLKHRNYLDFLGNIEVIRYYLWKKIKKSPLTYKHKIKNPHIHTATHYKKPIIHTPTYYKSQTYMHPYIKKPPH